MAAQPLNVSIDLRELSDELGRTRTKLDEWASRKAREARDIRDAHASTVHDQTSKLQGLQARYQQLSVQAQQVGQRIHHEAQELSSLQDVSARVHMERDTVHKRLTTLQQAVHAQEEELHQKESVAAANEAAKRKKIAALNKALHMYSSRLGLDFKQGSEELELVFTQIQATNPSRCFTVAVKINTDNTYLITRCEPAAPGLTPLVQRLNESNDFSEFVKGIRCEFFKLANP